jgi:hypothetical protein
MALCPLLPVGGSGCDLAAALSVVQAIERLAKYFEHTRRDYESALAYSEALLSQDTGNAAHQQRLNRVKAKLTKSRPDSSCSTRAPRASDIGSQP